MISQIIRRYIITDNFFKSSPYCPKSASTYFPNLVPTWIQLGLNLRSQFGPNLVLTWSQSGPNHDPGSNLILTWSQPGPNLVPTWSLPGPNLVPTWSQPGPNLVPTWSQPGHSLSSKNAQSLFGLITKSYYIVTFTIQCTLVQTVSHVSLTTVQAILNQHDNCRLV